MKKYFSTLILGVAFYPFFGQNLTPVPMPCTQITQGYNYGTIVSQYCIVDVGNATPQQTINVSPLGNTVHKAGNYIEYDGEMYIAPALNGGFEALIEKVGVEVAWFDPNGTAWQSVPKYEKLELGINLNAQVNTEIANFIAFSQTDPNDPTGATYGSVLDANKPGLNPFDPQDIDLKAEFSYFVDDGNGGGIWLDASLTPAILQIVQSNTGLYFPLNVYGFYYKELERNTTLPVEQRGWDESN